MKDFLPISAIVRDSALMKGIGQLKNVKGGVMKDFVLRVLISQDEDWWKDTKGEWKITAEHPRCPDGSYTPNYWEERVLHLLAFDITHSNFGLGFLDLMELDVSTFESIEEKVHKMAEAQTKAMPDDIRASAKMQNAK